MYTFEKNWQNWNTKVENLLFFNESAHPLQNQSPDGFCCISAQLKWDQRRHFSHAIDLLFLKLFKQVPHFQFVLFFFVSTTCKILLNACWSQYFSINDTFTWGSKIEFWMCDDDGIRSSVTVIFSATLSMAFSLLIIHDKMLLHFSFKLLSRKETSPKNIQKNSNLS